MGNKNAKANAPVLRKEDLDALVKSSGMTEQEVDIKIFFFINSLLFNSMPLGASLL